MKTEDTRIWHCENTDTKIITCILGLDIMFLKLKTDIMVYSGLFVQAIKCNNV